MNWMIYTSPKMRRRSHPAIRLLVLCRVVSCQSCVRECMSCGFSRRFFFFHFSLTSHANRVWHMNCYRISTISMWERSERAACTVVVYRAKCSLRYAVGKVISLVLFHKVVEMLICKSSFFSHDPRWSVRLFVLFSYFVCGRADLPNIKMKQNRKSPIANWFLT